MTDEIALPEGYILASVATYPRVMTDQKSGKQYTHSVQILNTDTFDCPRGVGMNHLDALRMAICNAGGDDGLSARLRKTMQGPLQ